MIKQEHFGSIICEDFQGKRIRCMENQHDNSYINSNERGSERAWSLTEKVPPSDITGHVGWMEEAISRIEPPLSGPNRSPFFTAVNVELRLSRRG
jgi:hypothetical protein